jgi:hypothetical protein
MFNKFLYQNKFVIEKHKIYWTIIIKKNNARLHIWKILEKNQYSEKKINLYKIKKKLQMNHTHLSKN